MKNSRIIAIGGGSIYAPCRPPTTHAIDEEAVRLARTTLAPGRKRPRLLFIPTASGDRENYRHDVYTQYELRLGCEYDDLCLVKEHHTDAEIAAKIARADIIYVGGGNTRAMMQAWELTGVTTLLRQAHQEGKILMGLSAGSICWFEHGLSDSNKFSQQVNWKPIWVPGLGLVPLLHSPHFDSEEWRVETLDGYLETGELTRPVLALDDNCAIEVVGEEYRIISSRPSAEAFVYCDRKRTRILQSRSFRPLSELLP